MKTFFKFFGLVTLLVSVDALSWEQKPNQSIDKCSAELPYGVPKLEKPNTLIKCNTGYALQHDNEAKIAAWAAWTVVPEESIGCFPRVDAFVADEALPKDQRAEPEDYLKSGFDRGHLVPDADLSYNLQAEKESFLMSNMSPQFPNLNRGVWKHLEASTRAWAWNRKHNITVYAGNIYKVGTSKTIGKNKVVVPEHLYKIVIDNTTKETLAFTFQQVEKQEIDLKKRLTSIAAVESASGVTFPVPEGVDKAAVAKDVWPADLGATAAAKKSSCKLKKH